MSTWFEHKCDCYMCRMAVVYNWSRDAMCPSGHQIFAEHRKMIDQACTKYTSKFPRHDDEGGKL